MEDSDEGEHKSAEDDEDDDGEGAGDYSKKKKTKTKAQVEKEALLMGDLYATLGLEDVKFEASEAQITKAYRKAALVFHPDKLGEKLTQKDKDVWLKI